MLRQRTTPKAGVTFKAMLIGAGLGVLPLELPAGAAPPREPTAVSKADRAAAGLVAVDLGTVEAGQRVDYTLSVAGAPNRAVRIARVHNSCSSCRMRLLDGTLIPRGGVARVAVSVPAKVVRGRVSQTVEVTTDDPDRPVQVFEVTVHAVPLLVVEPGPVSFGEVMQGAAAERHFRIRGGTIKAFELVAVDSSEDWIRVEKVSRIPEEKDTVYDLHLRLLEAAPAGPFRSTLECAVDVPDRGRTETFVISVDGLVSRAVVCEPHTLAFGPVRLGEQPARKVIVRRRGGPPLKITAVRCDEPRLKVSLTEAQPGEMCELQVTVTGIEPLGKLQASIEFEAEVGGAVVPPLPVYAYVLAKDPRPPEK
jgi:hypothetical protein